MKLGFIYGLTCACHPEQGVRYIGKTVKTVEHRVKQHLYEAKKKPRLPVHHWINKHGANNVAPVVLAEEADSDALLEKERQLIALYRLNGAPLLNLTDGGEGHAGFVQSEETIEKRRLAMAQVVRSKEWGSNISKGRKGWVPTPETRQKWSEMRAGACRSEEWHQRAVDGDFNFRTGERVTGAKLKDAEVPQIVDLMRSGLFTQRWVASQYGVDKAVVQRILKGTSHRAITGIGSVK